MPEVISKCGMNCAGCPWGPFVRKGLSEEELEEVRKRAKAILGYTPLKKACHLCQTPNEEIPKGATLPLRNCLVRQCVTRMGIKNCAYCSRFPCAFEKQHAGSWDREFFEKKLGEPLSEEDYQAFVKPFEALDRLETIRASLKPEQIVDALPVDPLEVKIQEFPKNLPFSKNEVIAFRDLYELLAKIKRSTLGVEDVDLFPQQQRLTSRILHFLRFLWIFGRYAKFVNEEGGYLVIDPESFINNRGKQTGLPTWEFLEKVVFKQFKKLGVHGENIPLDKYWKTPMGYLRKKGWEMKLTFDKKAGSVATLKALQAYTKRLEEQYDKKAFRYFKDVDMHVLVET